MIKYRMNKRKLVFASGIANAFEWYDYALFSLFALCPYNRALLHESEFGVNRVFE